MNNFLSWVLTIAMVLAVPISLLTWVWTGDLRWLGTGVLIAGCFGIVTIMGKSRK